MPFEKIPNFSGKVFVPEIQSPQKKKHPCIDCFSCQFCDDDRCRVCRNGMCRDVKCDVLPSSKKAD